MTSEVVIMNKLAIAMAADSVVTIRTEHGYKTYSSVNKLFALSKEQPIGIMVYGNSELMGIPWEALIKEYRRQNRGAVLNTVNAYADHFLTFLESNHAFFPEPLQRSWFRDTLADYLVGIWLQLDAHVRAEFDAGNTLKVEDVLEILAEGVEWFHKHLQEEHADLVDFPEELRARMRQEYRGEAEEAISLVFENLPIPPSLHARLLEVCFAFFSRDHFNPNFSGIVIAGFGESEIFPSMASLQVEGVFLNKVRYRQRENEVISVDTDAVIAPFAQQEMVHLFIRGIDPGYRRIVETQLTELFEAVPDAIVDAAKGMKTAEKEQLRSDLKELCAGWTEDFSRDLATHGQSEHIEPLTRAVAMLPKDDLAALAESLVNLTSLKQNVSLKIATVGGLSTWS